MPPPHPDPAPEAGPVHPAGAQPADSAAAASRKGAAGTRAASPLLGALDVGSNAIRYAVGHVDDQRELLLIEIGRFPVRLGQDAFESGRLSPSSIAAAVECSVRFRARSDALGVVRQRAVATSAIRESQNADELCAAVRAASGIVLEPISGEEEARLVWAAVRRHLQDEKRRPWILADLGGGSLELSVADADALRFTRTFPLGAVRLLNTTAAELRDAVDRCVLETTVLLQNDGEIAGVLLTGGSAEVLADLSESGGDRTPRRGPVTLAQEALHRLAEELHGLSVEERTRRFGLRPDRADVIAPAASVYARLTQLLGAERVLVPRVGLREGILRDLAARAPGVHPSL